MARALQALILIFGIACIGIALLHIVLGPASIPGSIPVNATMDSEDRFYASLFLGFGAALIWCSRALSARGGVLKALLAVFFVGGLARIVSWAAVGQPNDLFIFLGSLELILPPLFWWWHGKAYGGARSGAPSTIKEMEQ